MWNSIGWYIGWSLSIWLRVLFPKCFSINLILKSGSLLLRLFLSSKIACAFFVGKGYALVLGILLK